MAKEKYFSMRIEDDTLETLKAIAKASKRTSSGMVAYLVLKEAKRLGVRAEKVVQKQDKALDV